MPTFIGTAEPGWEIVLYDTNTHNGELGRTWSDPVTGEWSITLTTPLADGTYNNLKVEASDGVTHHALKSRAGPVVTIDTSAPLAPSAARLVTDSGQSATDGVTNVIKPSFTGTAAPGAIVTLYDGDIANGTAVPIGSVVTSALGVWTLAANSDLANGAHIITATTTDTAGNLGLSAALNIVIDAVAPTATIALSDSKLQIGETAEVTITFAERVFGFSNADLAIQNGTLSNVASSDGVTWTAIRLANTGLKDLAGNAGGTTTSNNYTIETTLPTATITMGKTALHIGDTSPVTITFSERVTNFSNADLTVENGTLTAVVPNIDGTIWTATFTPAANVTDALNLITLVNDGVNDSAGNAGAGTTLSSNYAIDTIRPSATITMSDSSLWVGETSKVTIKFSEAVTGLVASDFSVASGSLSAPASADGITWTATFTPQAGINADTSNVITLNGGSVVDLAGNTNLASSSPNYTVDTVDSPTIARNDFAGTDVLKGVTLGRNLTVSVSTSDMVANDTYDNPGGPVVTAVTGTGMTAVGGTASLSGGIVTFNPDDTYYGPAGFTYSLQDGSKAVVRITYPDYTPLDMTTAYEQHLQILYVEFFNRPADPDGFAYWLNDIKTGATFPSTANNFYLLSEFVGMASTDIVNRVYQNLFDRTPGQAEAQYWSDALDNSQNKGQIFWDIVGNAGDADKLRVRNKVLAADYFTDHVNTADEINAYSGENAIASVKAREYMELVTGGTEDALFNALYHAEEYVLKVTGVVDPASSIY